MSCLENFSLFWMRFVCNSILTVWFLNIKNIGFALAYTESF